MKRNVGTVDRVIRVIVGLLAFGGIFFVSTIWLKVLLGIVGIVMLFTAATGFCALYTLFGISTCPAKK
ncbi:MAG: DUF2892 domain-containing protein [candidate division WOR-3 bacterium]